MTVQSIGFLLGHTNNKDAEAYWNLNTESFEYYGKEFALYPGSKRRQKGFSYAR